MVTLFYQVRAAGALVFALVFTATSYAADIAYHGLNIPDQSGAVMTVRGPVPPEQIGQTLMHEHMLIQYFPKLEEVERWKLLEQVRLIPPPSTEEQLKLWHMPVSMENLSKLKYYGLNFDLMSLDKLSDTMDEVWAYKKLGGQTIVDVTPDPILGRQPEQLKKLSTKTDINIVMATGFYEAPWHPADMDDRTTDDLTRHMVREIVEGVGDTGIKAGIIGEISTTNMVFEPVSNDLRVLRAAGRASQLTGAAISLHNVILAPKPAKNNLHAALDVLEEEGVDLSRIIVGHIPGLMPPAGMPEPASPGFLESLLRRGVFLQFDTLGAPYKQRGYQTNDFQVDLLIELINRGYSDQLLVSHDIFTKAHLKKYGGFGLSFVHGQLIPYLLRNGIHQYQIDKITVHNPRRVLTFVSPTHLKQ